MQVEFSIQAEEDLIFFRKNGNKPVLKRILALVEDIKNNPFTGIRKPEPLKQILLGFGLEE